MGLDFSRLPGEAKDSAVNEHYKERQKLLFKQQLELARRLKLNVIIHQREAFEETLAILKGFTESARAVFHCFVGSPEERERIEKMNCLVSFTGIITFKNADLARETVRSAPLRGGFMVETDCPYLAPVPHRGKRCEPAHVMETARRAAELKQVTLEELVVETCRTARSFIRGVE
jgi:TatD DNase family protein